MDTYQTVMTWDESLRSGDWELARSMLSDEACWFGPDRDLTCDCPEEIIDLLRSYKGVNSDVAMLGLEILGNQAVAHLRQPDWGEEWFQVLTVDGGRIVLMEDFPNEPTARTATRP